MNEQGGQRTRRITLRDVASRAGVSLKTASNVVNGSGRMSAATRKRVQEVIDQSGYKVNAAARNLNRNKTGFITLAVPSLTPPYLSELANRVIDSARLKGYAVYVSTYAEGSAKGARDLLRSFNNTISDGIILSMSELEDFTTSDLDVSYPLVCVGARDTRGVADHVMVDDRASAAMAADYLFARQVRSLAVVGLHQRLDEGRLGSAREGNAELRMRGILEASRRRGVEIDRRLMGVTGYDWSLGRGYLTMQSIIDSGVGFDGVVALNDQLAIGALSALTANDIDVPGQVQLIGFDNIEESAYLQTPLTTMDSRLEWISRTSVNRILSRIGQAGQEARTLVSESRVIARNTTR
ncbi:LacI family DNA-binding transcriptional regulator [Bifidobacterium favimelis]